MKYENYIELVRRLQGEAARSRRFYDLKVLSLLALGYAYVVGMLLLLVLPIPIVVAGLFYVPGEIARLLLLLGKLWWIVLPGLALYFGFIGSTVKAITARVPEPNGEILERAAAPELFDFIDKACRHSRTRAPSKVLITDEFNAGVVTLPRFGIFGKRVIMILGLPLMEALSAEQFKATVAHEIGHISGKHGRFSKWTYQLRESWGRLMDSQELSNHRFSGLYKNFINWYFPLFTAYSFVLMREHENDADREAVELVGAEPLGAALVLLQTKETELNEVFWKQIHEENLSSDMPQPQLFSRMLGSLAFLDPDRAAVSLEQAVAVPTGFDNAHPSLADRLKAIGYWSGDGLPALPEPVSQSAAAVFLKNRIESLAQQFDRSWDEQTAGQWRRRHEHFQESEKRIREIETKSADEATVEEMLEMFYRRAEKEGVQPARPLIEEIVVRFPGSAEAWLALGSAKLVIDDESGLDDLRKCVNIDREFRFAASERAFEYLHQKGRHAEAQQYADAADEERQRIEKGQSERSYVSRGDQLVAPDPMPELVGKIEAKLGYFEEITAVYIVKKVVNYRPDVPMHVMFIGLRQKTRFRNRRDLASDEILKIVMERFDTGEISYFAVLRGQFDGLEATLDTIEGAKVYSR